MKRSREEVEKDDRPLSMRSPLPQLDFTALAHSDDAFKKAYDDRTITVDGGKMVLDLTKVKLASVATSLRNFLTSPHRTGR